MGMARGLEATIELAFHSGDVDDVLVPFRGGQHQWLEPGVENEWCNGIDEVHFK